MDLYYKKTGNGAPLVIIHGLYGSSDNWMNISKHLEDKYTIYLIDQRNHGRSGFADSHTYNDMRDDLAEFFEKHNIGKATVLGHSMGGKTAMWFAADYPEKIEKLIIADIAPKDYLLNRQEGQFYLHQNILLAMQDVDFSKVKSRNDVDSYLAEKIDDARIRMFLLKNIEKNKETKQLQWRINYEILYDYLEEIIGGVNLNWFEDRIPITAYPVIFIRGLLSKYIQDKDKELIQKVYPDAKIVDIPEAGHWLHAEQPQKFLEAVLLCC